MEAENISATAWQKAKVKQVETLSRYSKSDDSELDFITSITTSVVSAVNALDLLNTHFTKETFTLMEIVPN